MKTLGRASLGVGGLLLVGLITTVLFFLSALLFGGPWEFFFWAAGLSLALVVAIKILASRVFDDERQLLAAGMLSELLSGAFGWTWMVLAGASLFLFFKALLFSGSWWNFFVCLFTSAMCKFLLRYSRVAKEAALYKRELVAKGLNKEEAGQMWIAVGQEIVQQRLKASDTDPSTVPPGNPSEQSKP